MAGIKSKTEDNSLATFMKMRIDIITIVNGMTMYLFILQKVIKLLIIRSMLFKLINRIIYGLVLMKG